MSSEFIIKCVDARTHVFVGYLMADFTTRRQKNVAVRFGENAAKREVKRINAYGTYKAERVKV